MTIHRYKSSTSPSSLSPAPATAATCQALAKTFLKERELAAMSNDEARRGPWRDFWCHLVLNLLDKILIYVILGENLSVFMGFAGI